MKTKGIKMKIFITFTNLEHTPALDEHIHEKSQKLEKLWNGSSEIRWTCFINNGQHKAEVKWLGGKREYQASAEGKDMYRSIHEAVSKLEKQMVKEKDKIKNKMHRKTTELVINDPQSAWGDFEGMKQEEEQKVVDLAAFRKKKMSYEDKKKKKAMVKLTTPPVVKKVIKAKKLSVKKAQAPAKSKKILKITKTKKKSMTA